jgi:catechol 2,3-dioxygenase-like lactoylglutathione lyase family enzyme
LPRRHRLGLIDITSIAVLGNFLEFSLRTADIRRSLEFWRELGFSEAPVGEARTTPYAVLTDGRLCIGLHDRELAMPTLSFVHPNLLAHADALERAHIELDYRHLADNEFNEIGCHDPAGHAIAILEARTFSPVKRKVTETSLCGYFTEIGLPAPALETSKIFWERAGFVGMDEPESRLPHISCTSDYVDVGLYEPALLPAPTLFFETPDLPAALAALAHKGIEHVAAPAPFAVDEAAAIRTPEGTRILLLAATTEAPAGAG